MSEEWAQYRDDDKGRARFVPDTVSDEDWWGLVTYILDFTAPIYAMIRACEKISHVFTWLMKCGIP